jgi:hypothetical protein
VSIGAALDVIRYLRQFIVDKREARRWFIRWSIDAARTYPGTSAPYRPQSWPDILDRSRVLRVGVDAIYDTYALNLEDDVHPLIDPGFALRQRICWAFEVSLARGTRDLLKLKDDVAEIMEDIDSIFSGMGPLPAPSQLDPGGFQEGR